MTPTKNGMPNWPIDFAKRTIVFLGFLALEILRLRLVNRQVLQYINVKPSVILFLHEVLTHVFFKFIG